MSKIAILFAGQGAQQPGMGKSLYGSSPEARAVYEEAERIKPGITELCFDGAPEELNVTINTQPCVFVTDMAAYAAFYAAGARPDMAAGFSLGEYAALTAAGVFKFSEALELVTARAGWMQAAAERYGGGMVAVLGKTANEVEAIVGHVKSNGVLQAVNYNCPGQTVVAGDEHEIEALMAYAAENKLKASHLKVNGAFHSERMREPSDKIFERLSSMDLKEPAFPVYANATALPYGDDIKRTLAGQTASPVLFEQTLRHMIADGGETFFELGPGKTLAGFVKRIDKSVSVHSVNDHDSLLAIQEFL